MEKTGVFFIKSSLNVPLKLILLLFPEKKYITSFAKLLERITPDQWTSYFFFQLAIQNLKNKMNFNFFHYIVSKSLFP